MKSLRNSSSCRAFTGLSVVMALALPAASASAADEDNASETAAARSFAIDGMRLAQAGKCDEASEKLKHAEELHHSPIVLGRLGECYVALGRVVEGTEALRRMLREPLPENPSPALTQAYERAQAALDAAKPRIGALHISVEVPPNVTAKVMLDGKEISTAMLGGDLPADSGRHVVSVSASGHITATQDVRLDAGGRQNISLRLVRDPYAKTAVADTRPNQQTNQGEETKGHQSATSEHAPPPVVEEGGSRAPAVISWIVGAAGLGVGIGFGMSAIGAKNELTTNCPGGDCDPRYERDLNSAKLKGNIATVGFAVGGAGVLLGTILFATSGSSAKSETASVSGDTWASHRPRAWLSPSGVYFGADF